MPTNDKMLIDAAHPEETRVVVLRGNRVEEFDFESAAKKLLRGNIYLAKVTRVEPSLQAAFVDYGGNRHGFLAFNEIHPDYYQIPMADRQALLEAEAAAAAEAEAEADALASRRSNRASSSSPSDEGPEEVEETGGGAAPWALDGSDEGEDGGEAAGPMPDDPDDEPRERLRPAQADAMPNAWSMTSDADDAAEQRDTSPQSESESIDAPPDDAPTPVGLVEDQGVSDAPETNGTEQDTVESVGSEDALEEVPQRRKRPLRSYKIQEVIRRRQIMLVQVVKEERGNKGAALTTYLSLAGRYTVLMPNTGRGGGISRKITNAVDRKRLKEIATELEIPEGMGLIVRTAGASRSKPEIKRDYEYLIRLWETVRDLTLQSTAPALVYEEGNLIKRSIRDLYTKEIEEVVVAGEQGHKDAKDFMRMLMPSHAKNVKPYKEAEPLFVHYQIERQLNAMYSPYVTLRSGGYIVINQTEALVSIDVNSGKSTREHSIEETALATNLEASDEISRQLRLRDLAGLIVIDFIDMEERRNNRSVERRLKEALKNDRARIQVGRISHFGLLEMSRQRLRTGVLEGSTTQCPHCQGTGVVRSTESVALAVLRSLEDALASGKRRNMIATTSVDVALYLLNVKRSYIKDIEDRHGVTVAINANSTLHGANFRVEAGEEPSGEAPRPRPVVQMETVLEDAEFIAAAEPAEGEETTAESGEEQGDERRPRKRRRRRGRGDRPEGEQHQASRPAQAGRSAEHGERLNAANGGDDDDGGPGEGGSADEDQAAGPRNGSSQSPREGRDEDGRRRRRGRGRRGGRRNRRPDERGEPRQDRSLTAGEHAEPDSSSSTQTDRGEASPTHGASWDAPPSVHNDVVERSAHHEPRQRGWQPASSSTPQGETVELERAPRPALQHFEETAPPTQQHVIEPASVTQSRAPAYGRPEAIEQPNGEPAISTPDPTAPRRKGWWQRRFSGSE